MFSLYNGKIKIIILPGLQPCAYSATSNHTVCNVRKVCCRSCWLPLMLPAAHARRCSCLLPHMFVVHAAWQRSQRLRCMGSAQRSRVWSRLACSYYLWWHERVLVTSKMQCIVHNTLCSWNCKNSYHPKIHIAVVGSHSHSYGFHEFATWQCSTRFSECCLYCWHCRLWLQPSSSLARTEIWHWLLHCHCQ